jgi:hypothetical protein
VGVQGSNGAAVEVVKASALEDPDREADVWLGRYAPTTPTCEQVVTYVEGDQFAVFEQDRATGAVYRGGKLVWPSAPIVVATMKGGTKLRPGGDAALYFAQGPQTRITTIPDVLLVHRQFTVRPAAPGETVVGNWVGRARTMLAQRGYQPRRS